MMNNLVMNEAMAKGGMTIDTTREKDRMSVRIGGRLDTVTAPRLEETLKANMEGLCGLELDFSMLEFISSAGLRILLGAHKAMKKQNGIMVVRGIGEEIREVFNITGFMDILNVEQRDQSS